MRLLKPRSYRQVVLMALTMCVVILYQSQPVSSAETVGKVFKQRADAYGTPPGESRERKFPRYSVVYGELIETSGGAAILIKMIDDTELFLGERASLVIDDFVYDPQNKSLTAVYNFTIGTLRYISGKSSGDGVRIVTPTADIGIRGSEALIFVTPDGSTFVNVFDGAFSVSSIEDSDSDPIDVTPNQNVSVSPGAPVSAVSVGVQVPDVAPTAGVDVPNYGLDLTDLTQGGAFSSAGEGKVSGGAGHEDDHHDDDDDDGNGH
ncbi:MAG: FecR domain-containing protein [Magnetovibrio sp.]|nr:FecR domain-containing protein [Magnetovibrio sp.]